MLMDFSAFAKPFLEPGTVETVSILLDKYAFCEWDEKTVLTGGKSGAWRIDRRKYIIELRKDAETPSCGDD